MQDTDLNKFHPDSRERIQALLPVTAYVTTPVRIVSMLKERAV